MYNYGYKITDTQKLNHRILIQAYESNIIVAEFSCEKNRCCNCTLSLTFCDCANKKEKIWINPPGIQVIPQHRRRGLALTIYRLADVHLKLRIMPDTPPPLSESDKLKGIRIVEGQTFGTSEGKKLREKYEALYGDWKLDFYEVESDKFLPQPEILLQEEPFRRTLRPQS